MISLGPFIGVGMLLAVLAIGAGHAAGGPGDRWLRRAPPALRVLGSLGLFGGYMALLAAVLWVVVGLSLQAGVFRI
jgi:hypothetical protein